MRAHSEGNMTIHDMIKAFNVDMRESREKKTMTEHDLQIGHGQG